MNTLYTVGHGGSWNRRWENKHFDSLEDAWKFAGARLQEVQEQANKQRVTFKTFSERRDETDWSEVKLRNVKKDGTLGRWDYSVQVSPLSRPCDYWGCTTCQKYVQGKLYQRNGELQ